VRSSKVFDAKGVAFPPLESSEYRRQPSPTSSQRAHSRSRNAFVRLGWAPFATNAADLGSGTARCVGSSPSSCTKGKSLEKSIAGRSILDRRGRLSRRYPDDIAGSPFEFSNSGMCS